MALYGDANDPDLKAFLQQMKGSSQKKTWGNDDGYANAAGLEEPASSKKKVKFENKKLFKGTEGFQGEDDEEYQDFSTQKKKVSNTMEVNIEESSDEDLSDDERPEIQRSSLLEDKIPSIPKVDFFAGAKETSLDDPSLNGGRPMTYKQKMNLERRQSLATPVSCWSSFYMNHDAVMECVSKQLGVKKINLLNPEASSDMASRVALAETHVIQETRNYLLQEGVQLENPNFRDAKKIERSKTTILIKNIPYSTRDDEIAALFTPFGTLLRIILPPSKALAIVEFADRSDASKAFKGLAYRKFKHIPLYLEWVPEGLVTQPTTPHNGTKTNFSSNPLSNFVLNEKATAQDSSTIFIKNLNFASKESELKKLFEKYPGFVKCYISTRKDPKKPGLVLSCGFGFAEFTNIESAQATIAALKGVVLDGHILIFKNSQQSTSSSSAVASFQLNTEKNTKIIIRNIPFEATSRDVKLLFQPFGQIKKLRLPKKFDGMHRGFGFVEYSTHKEATIAYDAVKHSHLYGRHLVLEWAKNEDSAIVHLQELKEKSSQQLHRLTSKGPRKQGKIVMEEEDELATINNSDEDDDE